MHDGKEYPLGLPLCGRDMVRKWWPENFRNMIAGLSGEEVLSILEEMGALKSHRQYKLWLEEKEREEKRGRGETGTNFSGEGSEP